MSNSEKYEQFCKVVLQVRDIEYRHKQQRISDQSHAAFSLQYAELVEKRNQAKKTGSFSLLK
jgi:hypothetical protein